MDFGTLLHTAKKNDSSKKGVRYYSTKFEPPKKEQRNKTLSVNVQKFLAKKEAEEKQKLDEANKKREELLALRAQDKKSTRRVNVMLKRTKSANQSVLADAITADHTAITMTGNQQPDEDDYGYVSQEAADFYNKMMEKYNKMPDEPKFPTSKKKISTNLNNAKERVIAALEREKEEANMPHKRKRKHEIDDEKDFEEPKPQSHQQQAKPKPKCAPPPMNFADLLKVAEKKQYEPIVIEKKKEVEEERPLTKKQKRELERQKEYMERKLNGPQQQKPGTFNKIPKITSNQDNKSPKSDVVKPSSSSQGLNGDVKIKAVTDSRKTNGDVHRRTNDVRMSRKEEIKNTKPIEKISTKPAEKCKSDDKFKKPNNVPSYNSLNGHKNNQLIKRDQQNGSMSSKHNLIENSKSLLGRPVLKQENISKKPLATLNGKPKEFPPSDVRGKRPLDKPKEFPPRDLKPKQFPPADVRRKDDKKKILLRKRRIMDDDDEEYDSEMDDFIDDGPDDEYSNYSKYISEIFGYDKSKYRNLDEDVDNMESTFAQQMREEVISTKIGIMEDLEDMKMEEEEKRKKILRKKGKL